MLMQSYLQSGFNELTYCKIKGHILKELDSKKLEKKDGGYWIDAECTKCHSPVIAWVDSNDTNYYFVAKLGLIPEGSLVSKD